MLLQALLPIILILAVFGGFTALAVRSNRQAFFAARLADGMQDGRANERVARTAAANLRCPSKNHPEPGKFMTETVNNSIDFDPSRLIADLTDQLHELTCEHQHMEHDLKERDLLIRDLKRELEQWMSRVPPLLEELKQRSSELKQRAATIQDLEARLKQTVNLQRDNELQCKMIEVFNQQLDDAREANERLSRELARSQGDASTGEEPRDTPQVGNTVSDALSAPELYSVAPDESDDLTRIKGIGKGFAARLNDLGIFTVRQIAALEPGNIRWMEQQLQGLKGRIERDRWVEQAVEMCGLSLPAIATQQ